MSVPQEERPAGSRVASQSAWCWRRLCWPSSPARPVRWSVPVRCRCGARPRRNPRRARHHYTGRP